MSKQAVTRMLLVALFPSLGWLLPAVLWAQVSSLPPAGSYAVMTPAQLELEVEALASEPDRFGEAGNLLEQAGRMLAVEDPASVGLLIRAARLQYFGGELARARASMKEAAWRALGQGQPRLAANAYADAAIIAVEQHDGKAASDLVAIVGLLSKWPGVTRADRAQIMKRIG